MLFMFFFFVEIADHSLPCMYHKFSRPIVLLSLPLVILPLTPQRANVLLSVVPAGRRRAYDEGAAGGAGGPTFLPPRERLLRKRW